MNMKILIIEDEYPAAQKLSRLLKGADRDSDIVRIIPSVEQAVNWFKQNDHPELIFMDIQLEDGVSFEIFEQCRIDAPVIFTTAYDEYTLKAFKVNSVDYLLKPIVTADLLHALDKYNTIHRKKTENDRLLSVISQLHPMNKERFLIKIGEHYKPVPVNGINCFYINERCTFIHTTTGKIYPVDYSLDKIEQMVDPKKFFRINRNFIINITAINDILAYSTHRLKIKIDNWKEKEDILVSRERVAGFKEWMDR